MINVSFIIKSHLRSDDSVLVGGAAKNPYRLVKYLASSVDVRRVIYFEGDHNGQEPYQALRFRGALKLYAKTLVQNLRSARSVWRAFRDSDVVQCHHPHYGLAAALCRRLGVGRARFVVKAHGTAVPELEANGYRGWKGALLRLNAKCHLLHDRFVLSCADVVLCSSEFQRDEMTALYGVDGRRVCCIYNGYDPQYVTPGTRPASPTQGSLRMVFCGRVVPKKGIGYAIRLFQALAHDDRNARLHLVLGRRAQVEDQATYRRIAEEVARDSRIRVHHDLPEPDLYRLFDSATAGVVPSENYESIPTVVIEMLAAGLPTFATYKWGIPEILPAKFGLTGVFEDDVARMRSAMSDGEFMSSARELSTSIREVFSYTELTGRYLDVYRRLTVACMPPLGIDAPGAATSPRHGSRNHV